MRRWVVLVIAFATVACGESEARHVFPEGGYQTLSQTGLYAEIARKRIASSVKPYDVAHVLWSDGAEKHRWLRLPSDAKIDTSDMDYWQLPVGAQLFKEFIRDGVRVETRLVERIADTGNPIDDFWVGAFVWRDDDSDAVFAAFGQDNARGTVHDVPSVPTCWRCHSGHPGSILGLGALQLSHQGEGLTIAKLAANGQLTNDPARDFQPPGDATTSQALGYLHANCGHCHNPYNMVFEDIDMNLLVSVDDAAPEDTAIYQSTVDIALQGWPGAPEELVLRIASGDPDHSGLLYRMGQRSPADAMPPIASEETDAQGIAAVLAWITSL